LKNKKLLIFSYDFPPSNGGIARLCNEIANGMFVEYIEIIIVTRKKEGPQQTYHNNAYTIIELPTQRLKCEWEAYTLLKSIANKQDYHLLCGVWHPEATISRLAGFKNINVLTHGTELLHGEKSFRKYFWMPFYAKSILNKTNIIANSAYTAKLSRKIAPKATVTALPLAVNHTYFKPKKDKKNKKIVIGTVSRILQFKGHDFVLKVIHSLPQSYKNKVEWQIAGTGPYLKTLKKDVERLGLQEFVKFKGFLPDETLSDFYANLDVFILATRESRASTKIEGFGLVFLEAQACGIPVIGTNTGGIPSAIAHKNGGWLIAQDNEQELTELLKNLIDKPIILREQGLKARLRAEEECTWELYCQQLFKILK
jgi:phosphatidylinositol alpha-1,6-mannosyltransferase